MGLAMVGSGLLLLVLASHTEDGEEPAQGPTFANTKGIILRGAALSVASVVLFTGVRAWVFADGKRALQRSEAK